MILRLVSFRGALRSHASQLVGFDSSTHRTVMRDAPSVSSQTPKLSITMDNLSSGLMALALTRRFCVASNRMLICDTTAFAARLVC